MLNSSIFHYAGNLLVNRDAIQSIGRIVFTSSPMVTAPDWSLINDVISRNPEVVLDIIDFEYIHFEILGNLCHVIIDGVIPLLTQDISEIATEMTKIGR